MPRQSLSNNMNSRIDKVKRVMARLNLDALLVSMPSNIFYLSGFPGHDSLLLVTKHSNHLITDFRYEEQARMLGEDFRVSSDTGGLFQKTADIVKSAKIKRIGYESHHITVRCRDILCNTVKADCSPTFNIIEKLREVKDIAEIGKIKSSVKITRQVLGLITKHIRPGVKENSIACRIDQLSRSLGAEAAAFDTIVLSGANSSMPHGRPGNKQIRPGESVVVDFGCRVNGYSSDLTRTFFMGKICKYINIIYSIVRSAQNKAIDKIMPGAVISDIDKAARSYISDKGFGKYFGHATGHGIGLDVHELPSISSKNHAKLKEGMVFSVEPGIYIPGEFGIRIEDMVVVKDKGCEVITR
jgi:Xaa-Pro aminopeptidase